MTIVNFLLKHHARVDDTDDSDQTALYLSCSNGHLDVVQALVGHGRSTPNDVTNVVANVNKICKDGRTALIVSAGMNIHILPTTCNISTHHTSYIDSHFPHLPHFHINREGSLRNHTISYSQQCRCQSCQ